MIHILLVILKIIGLILASLLGLFLILVLLVLFAPIRYRLKAHYNSMEDYRIEFKGSFLGPLVRFFCEYKPDGKPIYYHFRFFGFRFLSRDKATAVKKPKVKNTKRKETSEKKDLPKAPKINSDTQQTESSQADTASETKDSRSAKATRKHAEHRTGLLTRVKQFWKRIRNTGRNFLHRFSSASDFFISIGELKEEERFRGCLSKIFGKTKRLLHHIRPKKCRLSLYFGTGEPDSTGKILGALSILYAFWGGSMDVKPDFENRVLQGELFVKGKIRGFFLLKYFIHIYFGKDFKYIKYRIAKIRRS